MRMATNVLLGYKNAWHSWDQRMFWGILKNLLKCTSKVIPWRKKEPLCPFIFTLEIINWHKSIYSPLDFLRPAGAKVFARHLSELAEIIIYLLMNWWLLLPCLSFYFLWLYECDKRRYCKKLVVCKGTWPWYLLVQFFRFAPFALEMEPHVE